MDQEHAREIIADWAREEYGKLLSVREVVTVRRATGRVWSGDLYCSTREGDIHVGVAIVDEHGKLIQTMNVDQFIDALVTIRTSNSEFPGDPTQAMDEEGDFGGLSDDTDFSSLADEESDFSGFGDDSDDVDSVFDGLDPVALQEQANNLISTGERQNLLEARNILPKLLVYQDKRGFVLQQMGELELLLGELEMGVRHLEASAREYADLVNLEGLSQVAELTLQILGEDQFGSSPVKSLFDQTRIKLRPLERFSEAPLFVGLGEEELTAIEGIANPVTIDDMEVLLREGDVANMAFIIKSGTLSIRLESPDGSMKVVRSCFPGDFIGETSVLGEPGATCTATVRGESVSELWQFDGHKLRALCDAYPEVRIRIESAKTLHQLDSFISMNESTATLDVSMRDRLLACITGISRVNQGSVLSVANQVPEAVYLIVSGKIEYRVKRALVRAYSSDQFVGLRDTLHELPLDGEFIAATDCLLVYMDPDRLKAIAIDATPEIIAVLEKLE